MQQTGVSKGTFAKDLMASVVVFLVALPLCMGIAIASGVSPATGLVTGIIGGLVVGTLSGCPLQVSGPAAGLAVIVYDLIQRHGIEMLGPLVVVAGLIQIGAALLRAGQLFRAIAPAVIYGMLAGIGVLIFSAQFHVMLDDKPKESGLMNLVSIPQAVYKGLFTGDGTHHLAAAIGILTIGVILLWTRFAPPKVKWVPAALVAVVCGTLAAHLSSLPIRYVDLPENLLSSIQVMSSASFARMLEPQLLLAAAALAFVASAETLLSAAAVDQLQDGPRTNYDRELVSQGIGNALSGLAGGLPMTGVIVRSATNVAAGAKTRKSAIMHGAWLLLLVAAAPWVLRLVPTASLAAILVYTGYRLVNVQNIRRLLDYGKVLVAIYCVTVAVIVAKDLLSGIITGLVLSLANVIYRLAHMNINVESRAGSQRRIDVHLGGAATFMRLPQLVDTLEQLPKDEEVHIHFDGLGYIDDACLDAIANWERQRIEKGTATVVEWDELMAKYRARNKVETNKPEFDAVGAGH